MRLVHKQSFMPDGVIKIFMMRSCLEQNQKTILATADKITQAVMLCVSVQIDLTVHLCAVNKPHPDYSAFYGWDRELNPRSQSG